MDIRPYYRKKGLGHKDLVAIDTLFCLTCPPYGLWL